MKTITDKLADALRQAIAATDKQAELLKAGVRDIPCPRDEARDAWREALAAYDAQSAEYAERITACVNACAGMTTAEVLEFGAPGELGRCAQAWVAEDNDNA